LTPTENNKGEKRMPDNKKKKSLLDSLKTPNVIGIGMGLIKPGEKTVEATAKALERSKKFEAAQREKIGAAVKKIHKKTSNIVEAVLSKPDVKGTTKMSKTDKAALTGFKEKTKIIRDVAKEEKAERLRKLLREKKNREIELVKQRFND
jgi:hypothetical protein